MFSFNSLAVVRPRPELARALCNGENLMALNYGELLAAQVIAITLVCDPAVDGSLRENQFNGFACC